jgi:hypothetical protein
VAGWTTQAVSAWLVREGVSTFFWAFFVPLHGLPVLDGWDGSFENRSDHNKLTLLFSLFLLYTKISRITSWKAHVRACLVRSQPEFPLLAMSLGNDAYCTSISKKPLFRKLLAERHSAFCSTSFRLRLSTVLFSFWCQNPPWTIPKRLSNILHYTALICISKESWVLYAFLKLS